MKAILTLALTLTLLTTACGEGNVKRSIPVGDEVDFGAETTTTQTTATTVVPSTTEAPTTTTEGVTETTEVTTATTERVFREAGCGLPNPDLILYEDEVACVVEEGAKFKDYIYDLDGDLRLITSFPLTNTAECEIAKAFYTESAESTERYKTKFENREQGLIGSVEYREENGNCKVYAKKLLSYNRAPAELLNTILNVWDITNTEASNYVVYNCHETTGNCHYYAFPVEDN